MKELNPLEIAIERDTGCLVAQCAFYDCIDKSSIQNLFLIA